MPLTDLHPVAGTVTTATSSPPPASAVAPEGEWPTLADVEYLMPRVERDAATDRK